MIARLLPGVVVVVACAWSARVCVVIAATGALFGDMFPLLVAHVHGLASSLSARDADAWIHGANLGYPAGSFAPLLPSLVPASLHALGVDIHASIHIALALPVVLLPLSMFAGLRLASLAPWPAAIAAAASAFVLGSRYGIGIEPAFGAALLDETWAALFLPLAVGAGMRFVTTTRGLPLALSMSIACALCHPVVGACCLVAWLIATLLAPRRDRRLGAIRFARLVALLAVGVAPMTLPALATWRAHGVFGPHLDDGDGGFAPARFIAFVVHALDGEGERVPVLTLLALIGIIATAARAVGSSAGPRDDDSAPAPTPAGTRFVVIVFACCIILLLGPFVAWGMVPWGRFVALLQLALCALVGIGLVDIVTLCTRAVPLGRSAALGIIVRASLALSVFAVVVIAGHAMNARLAAFRSLADEPNLARDLRELEAIAQRSSPAARVAAVGSLRTVSRHALTDEGWPGLWSSIGPSVSSSPNAALLSRDDVVDTVSVTNTGLILVAADAPAGARPAQRDFMRAGRFHVYDTGQRNWFTTVLLDAPAADGASFDDQARAWWAAAGYRTGRHLVAGHAPRTPGRGKVTILEEEVTPSRFSASLDVATDGPRAVMLKVSWHPWWRAFVDDTPVPALRVSPALLAAEVAPGLRTLTFVFVRPWWTLLLWLVPPALIAATLRQPRSGSGYLR